MIDRLRGRLMNQNLMKYLRVTAGIALAAGISKLCLFLNSNRSTAAMLTVLLAVLVATLGDWLLALLTSVAGIAAFSWYFIDTRIPQPGPVEAVVTFATMALTALTATFLALRAERRTNEAETRRRMFEAMTKLGQRMAAASGQSFSDVAQAGVSGITTFFGLEGARLRLGIEGIGFESGQMAGTCYKLPLRAPQGMTLELFGDVPPPELLRALGGLVSLHLEKSLAMEERARTEAEKRSEALRSTILNALAHDFKTPLTSIKVAASMLSGRPEGDPLPAESAREMIEVIDEEADRLERLLRESLDLARLDGRRRDPGEEECEVADVVERVRSKMARYVGRREFVVKVAPNLPRVKGDAFLFEQMLTQVTDNAWKYSAPASRIEISAALSGGGTLLLTVRNEGSQVPAGELEMIFDKFYRGSNQSSKSEGSGLGLAIARTIAETYGGRIRVEAEPLGMAFHFELLTVGGAPVQTRAAVGHKAE